MTGNELRQARMQKNWKQQELAKLLKVSQGYVSLLEANRRPLPYKLLQKLMRVLDVPPTSLPLPFPRVRTTNEQVPNYAESLGALGYPAFSYLRSKVDRNPADLLLDALMQRDLDSRVAEGLPWLAFNYVNMDWNWLVQNAKLKDLQNRLGFVVTLARSVAEKKKAAAKTSVLMNLEAALERSRLAREDTFCHDSITETEKVWLREKRAPEARRWNLLTDLAPEHLPYAA